jgi:hypothetical protein
LKDLISDLVSAEKRPIMFAATVTKLRKTLVLITLVSLAPPLKQMVNKVQRTVGHCCVQRSNKTKPIYMNSVTRRHRPHAKSTNKETLMVTNRSQNVT